MNLDKLNIPVPNDFSNPAALTGVKDLKKWIAALPLFNLKVSIKSLYDALDFLNYEPVPVKRRLELLELYHETVLNLFPSLEQDALKTLLPDKDQREAVLTSYENLLASLCTGYKVLISNALRQQIAPGKHPVLQRALYRVIQWLSLATQHRVRRYARIPKQTLVELNCFYHVARQFKLTTVTDNKNPIDKAVTLEHQYLACVVLLIADPYHMEDGTQSRAALAILSLANHIIVTEKLQTTQYKISYRIDLSLGRLPEPLSMVSQSSPMVIPVYLYLDDLVMQIRELRELGKNESDSPRDAILSLANLKLLQEALMRSPKRRAPRKITRLESHIVHHFELIWNIIKTQKLSPSTASVDCTISNISTYGCKAVLTSEEKNPIAVSSLIAVNTPLSEKSKPAWHLGLIRWAKENKDHQFDLGIEYINRELKAVLCKIDDSESSGVIKGILSEAGVDSTVPSLLILPPMNLPAQTSLLIHDVKEKKSYEIVEMTLDGSDFQEYEIRRD
jgi:hypothetical protein